MKYNGLRLCCPRPLHPCMWINVPGCPIPSAQYAPVHGQPYGNSTASPPMRPRRSPSHIVDSKLVILQRSRDSSKGALIYSTKPNRVIRPWKAICSVHRNIHKCGGERMADMQGCLTLGLMFWSFKFQKISSILQRALILSTCFFLSLCFQSMQVFGLSTW